MSVYQSGDTIADKYRITGILGRGGVAITYQAIDLTTESEIAIKVISLKQLDNWKQIELFQREAGVLAKLNHPAIPQYIDYFDIETESDLAFYIVQQLAPGKSLLELVESGWRTTEAEVKKIAEQVLNILSYLHSLEPPVIHRDLKPNNLIRSDDGTIYLVDFGAVQNTYYNTLMQGSTVVGTYGYMAPEQFRGKALPATDLYSLGATILYLLTHRSPSELPQDTLKLDFRSSVNISESFADWLEKILEPDLEDRFVLANIALAELLASDKVQPKKLITRFGIGFIFLISIWGFTSYKWFFLSRLGFAPYDVCTENTILHPFFRQGGSINSLATDKKIFILACIIKYENNENIKKILTKTNHFTAIINYLDANNSLLKQAIYRDDTEILELLIDMKAKVNVQSSFRGSIASIPPSSFDSDTILHTAAYGHSNNAIEVLIENGADVNTRGRDGNTPLFYTIYYSVRYGNTDAMKLLIENGANINIRNYYGETPLLYAVSDPYTNKRIEPFKLLLEHGASVNTKDYLKNKDTPLHKAVDEENKDITKLLIEHGADVNARNKNGDTPLHKAVDEKNKDIAKLLIEHGTDVNAQNKDGKTPLSIAVFNLDRELTPLLIDNGAKANFMLYELMKDIHDLESFDKYQKIDEFLKQYEGR